MKRKSTFRAISELEGGKNAVEQHAMDWSADQGHTFTAADVETVCDLYDRWKDTEEEKAQKHFAGSPRSSLSEIPEEDGKRTRRRVSYPEMWQVDRVLVRTGDDPLELLEQVQEEYQHHVLLEQVLKRAKLKRTDEADRKKADKRAAETERKRRQRAAKRAGKIRTLGDEIEARRKAVKVREAAAERATVGGMMRASESLRRAQQALATYEERARRFGLEAPYTTK